MAQDYDIVIIGAGPGGLTAALYCARARLKTVILEKENLGGAIVNADNVENWPGLEQGIPGAELAGNMLSQVMNYGVDIQSAVEARRIEIDEMGLIHIETSMDEYTVKAVIISGGTRPKKLNIPGEENFTHFGISYCVMCDGASFAGKEVAIIGGGDTGVSGALYMDRLGCKIFLIESTERLNASKILLERLKHLAGIQIFLSTWVEGIEFDGERKTLTLRNEDTGEKTILRAQGVFVLAGREPQTEYLKDLLELDEDGYIRVNHYMETNVPGIFAAGDIRSGSAMQLITAAGDGAMAAISAERYINARPW